MALANRTLIRIDQDLAPDVLEEIDLNKVHIFRGPSSIHDESKLKRYHEIFDEKIMKNYEKSSKKIKIKIL